MPKARALEGKRIVLTRAREQADELGEKLRALGATPLEYPMIEICPPSDSAPLECAIRNVMQYDWVVFSSTNGVKYFCGRFGERMPRARIAAVGEQTAQALRQNGWRVDALPGEFLAGRLADALGDVRNLRILLVRPEASPPDLSTALRARGALVDEVAAYRTRAVAQPEPLALDEVDAITLASASAASNFGRHVPAHGIPARVCMACIGPSTAQAARQAGLRVDVVAPLHSVDGLVLALVDYFNSVEVTP